MRMSSMPLYLLVLYTRYGRAEQETGRVSVQVLHDGQVFDPRVTMTARPLAEGHRPYLNLYVRDWDGETVSCAVEVCPSDGKVLRFASQCPREPVLEDCGDESMDRLESFLVYFSEAPIDRNWFVGGFAKTAEDCYEAARFRFTNWPKFGTGIAPLDHKLLVEQPVEVAEPHSLPPRNRQREASAQGREPVSYRPSPRELVDCFRDTLDRASQEPLAEETARAAASCVIYRPGFVSHHRQEKGRGQVDVTANTSFAEAERHVAAGRVAVLNFANPHYPGGGVTSGAMSQEECLCRSSNLYPCLAGERLAEEYYKFHREQTDYFFSDALVYTRDVTVFKDDSPLPKLLPEREWFQVDVITCAAPYLAKRRYTNRAYLTEVFKSRIRSIFEAALDNGVDILILGAFGCGAFKNPPDLVAKAFREVIAEHRYGALLKKIVFAIKPSSQERRLDNYAIFRDILSPDGGPAELEPVLSGLTLPGGNVLSGEKLPAFLAWQRSNPYFGRQFSILGDSISTLEGYNPRGYRVHYQGETCGKTGVQEMADTWWGKVIGTLGGELLVNNAWSGSMVARHPSQVDTFPSACSPRRTENLHLGTVKPDVILIYLGINDWANGIVPTYDGIRERITTFQGAYELMLESLREDYPQAEVWCCTLDRTVMSGNPGFSFPERYGGFELSQYNNVIRMAAYGKGCKVLDLEQHQLRYDTADGTHPNAAGMDTLAVLMLRQLMGGAADKFLDCPEHDYQPIQLENHTANYVCKKCGRRHSVAVSRPEPKPAPAVLRLRRRDTGETLELNEDLVMAGRSRECGLWISSGYVARQQALFVRLQHWCLRDYNSKNGTYLNGTRLDPAQQYPLKRGDIISFARMVELEVL